MAPESSNAVRQVLREASDHSSYAGWTFAERLVWMIARGFELGRIGCNSAVPEQSGAHLTKLNASKVPDLKNIFQEDVRWD